MRKQIIAGVCMLVAAGRAAGLSFGVGVLDEPGPAPLPPLQERDALPFPAWVPEETRDGGAGGRTNVLGLSARWVFTPPAGRTGLLHISYSNRLDQAFLFGEALQRHGLFHPSGMLLLALRSGGEKVAVSGFPENGMGRMGGTLHLEANAVAHVVYDLEPAVLAGLAGSQGLVVAYAGLDPTHRVPYWTETAPLPPPGSELGLVGTNEWLQLRSYWLEYGEQYLSYRILELYPEIAKFFPGVILDAALPESFRLEFAKQMPPVDAYDPAVLLFIQNAPDKNSPLVIAALGVLRRSRGATPDEGIARRAVNHIVYALSQDNQNPLLFRLHAAYTFPVKSWYLEFLERTEPEFRLMAANEIRGFDIEKYTEAKRNTIRQGLQPLLSSNTPYIAGPLQWRFPDNVTIGQAAQQFLTEFEARWTANPPPQ